MDGSTESAITLDPLDGLALRRARRFARSQAERRGMAERGDDAALAAAELLEGAEGAMVPTALQVSEADGGLVVGVDLEGRRPLHLHELSEALLSGLSSAWGWEARPRGVHAWCRLPAGGRTR
ncbi:hypothetical protein [Kineococcus sp. SYSU DK006]|uniref:hypothetical protein n=1 Tax=Kineococcus sp. SYSU DK006 TaxID=3383127 RepID=UPI003D7E1F0D